MPHLPDTESVTAVGRVGFRVTALHQFVFPLMVRGPKYWGFMSPIHFRFWYLDPEAPLCESLDPQELLPHLNAKVVCKLGAAYVSLCFADRGFIVVQDPM